MELITKVDYPIAPFKVYLPVKVIKPTGEFAERLLHQGVIPLRHPIFIRDVTFLRRLVSERQMVLHENDYLIYQAKKIMQKHNQLDNMRKEGEQRWSKEEIKTVSESLLIDLEVTQQQIAEIQKYGVPEEDPVTTLVTDQLSNGIFTASVLTWYNCKDELKRKKINLSMAPGIPCLAMDLIRPYQGCGNWCYRNVYTDDPEGIVYLKERLITLDT